MRIPRDGVELAARLLLPAPGAGVVVFVHGLGSSKNSPRNVVIAERLCDVGLGALLFDLSGHGDSSPSAGDREGDAFVDDRHLRTLGAQAIHHRAPLVVRAHQHRR